METVFVVLVLSILLQVVLTLMNVKSQDVIQVPSVKTLQDHSNVPVQEDSLEIPTQEDVRILMSVGPTEIVVPALLVLVMEVDIENVSILVTEQDVDPTLSVWLSTTDLSADVLPSMLVTQTLLLDVPKLNVKRIMTAVVTKYVRQSTTDVWMLVVRLAVVEAPVLQRTINQPVDVSQGTYSLHNTTNVLILMNVKTAHVNPLPFVSTPLELTSANVHQALFQISLEDARLLTNV